MAAKFSVKKPSESDCADTRRAFTAVSLAVMVFFSGSRFQMSRFSHYDRFENIAIWFKYPGGRFLD